MHDGNPKKKQIEKILKGPAHQPDIKDQEVY